jgi:hypothetical protein
LAIVDRKTPLLYSTVQAPTKESIKSAESRPLEAFELAALKVLQAGKEVHVADAKHHAVFGVLRADESCLRCHEGKWGDLFGAFKYTVMPMPALKLVPSKKPAPSKQKAAPLLSQAN